MVRLSEMKFRAEKLPGIFFWIIFLFAFKGYCLPVISQDNFRLDFSGYLQEQGLHSPDFWGSEFSLNQARARLVLDFSFWDRLRMNLSQSLELSSGSALKNPFYQLSHSMAPETYFHWEKKLVDEEDYQLDWSIYRAWLGYEDNRIKIRLGRQRIALGSAYFYSPLDIFNPTSPLSLEPEERVGVDGASLEVYLGRNTYLSFAYGIGDVIDESRFAGFFKTTLKSYDLTFMGARLFQDWVFGLAFSGYISSASFYGELSYTLPEETDEFFRGTLGVQYSFPENIFFTAEYYHNEGLLLEEDFYSSSGMAIYQDPLRTLDRNFLGISVNAELTPLVQFTSGMVYDLDSNCFFIGPGFSYLAPYSLTVQAGVQLFGGQEEGDFGFLPNFFWARLRWDF